MSKSGLQVNDANARNVIALLQGHEPASFVDPDGHPRTPNQRVEAAAAMVGSKDPAIRAKGIAKSIDFLEAQQVHGFQCIGPAAGQNECLTDSHAPIWLRAMAALTLFAATAFGEGVSDTPRLQALVDWWWSSWRSLMALGLVPSGPLKGQIILPCARKTGLPGDEAKISTPGDAVTAGVYQLANGGKLATKGLNTKALTLSADKPDLAAVALARQILLGPGFGPDFKSGALPKLASPMVVTRTPQGHVANFPDGIPGAIDAAPRCWVEYGSGRFHFGNDPTPFSILVSGSRGTAVEGV